MLVLFVYLSLLFVTFHPIFFILSNNAITAYLVPNFSTIPLTLGAISFYIFIIVMIASQWYKKNSHTAWQYIHVLTYLLFFFGLYHAFYWGSDSQAVYIKILYATLLSGVMIGAIYRIQYKIRKYYINKFYLKEIKQETLV